MALVGSVGQMSEKRNAVRAAGGIVSVIQWVSSLTGGLNALRPIPIEGTRCPEVDGRLSPGHDTVKGLSEMTPGLG